MAVAPRAQAPDRHQWWKKEFRLILIAGMMILGVWIIHSLKSTEKTTVFEPGSVQRAAVPVAITVQEPPVPAVRGGGFFSRMFSRTTTSYPADQVPMERVHCPPFSLSLSRCTFGRAGTYSITAVMEGMSFCYDTTYGEGPDYAYNRMRGKGGNFLSWNDIQEDPGIVREQEFFSNQDEPVTVGYWLVPKGEPCRLPPT